MKSVKDFYNKTCIDWADKWYENEEMIPFLKKFTEKLSSKPRILDLCCGAGYESMRLNKLGAEVVGIDISEESIKIARDRNPNIKFYVGDILEDFSYINQVDGIICVAGLIHIPFEKLRDTFYNSSKVLKKNGLYLITIKEGTGKQKKQSYVTIDGINFDREFYAHTKEELIKSSKGIFEYIEELIPDENNIWKTYIFKKIVKDNKQIY